MTLIDRPTRAEQPEGVRRPAPPQQPVTELDMVRARYTKNAKRLAEALDENIRLKRELTAIKQTLSWRITAPLRGFRRGASFAVRCVRALDPRNLPKAVFSLYRRMPLSTRTRTALHTTLSKLSPRLYLRMMRAAGAAPPGALAPSAPIQASVADIVGESRFRAGFRRLMADLAAHAADFGAPTHVIALPFFAVGGAQVTAMNFARAVTARRQACILLAVDKRLAGRPETGPGVLAIDLEDYFPQADALVREHLLFALLRIVQPHVFHAINSEVAWRLLIRDGDRVRRLTKVFGGVFAFQFDWKTGEKVGYAATFLKPAFPALDGVIADNKRFADDAAREYGLEAERGRFHVVYNTMDMLTPELLAQGSAFAASLPTQVRDAKRLSVLWAGRLDAEKRPELLLAAAEACPNMDFHVYGSRVVDSELAAQFQNRPNLFLHGAYNTAAEVMARREHHAMMFTSRWEGLANVLIEFGAHGLPIVAATVGGVGELIRVDTGYPVSERPSVDEYVNALNAIHDQPEEAAKRAAALIALIGERHSRSRFEQSVATIEGYLA